MKRLSQGDTRWPRWWPAVTFHKTYKFKCVVLALRTGDGGSAVALQPLLKFKAA
jgi:hypothetical protein